jgi:hypothetical protein
MATAYDEIFTLFLAGIQDYKIDALYNSARPTDADVYMADFLVRAIPYFDNCAKDLEDRNDTTRTFNINLTTDERVILSELMIVQWCKKEVNDIRQMELHLSDPKAFKHYAEANNLKEKRELMNTHGETADKLMLRYGQKNIDWNDFM